MTLTFSAKNLKFIYLASIVIFETKSFGKQSASVGTEVALCSGGTKMVVTPETSSKGKRIFSFVSWDEKAWKIRLNFGMLAGFLIALYLLIWGGLWSELSTGSVSSGNFWWTVVALVLFRKGLPFMEYSRTW